MDGQPAIRTEIMRRYLPEKADGDGQDDRLQRLEGGRGDAGKCRVAQYDQNPAFIVFVIALILCILALINSYISSRITNPIRELEKSVGVTEAGNLSAPVHRRFV